MLSRFLVFVVLILTVGCAHDQLPSQSVWTTQTQLSLFTERALASMRSHEGIRLPNGGVTPVVGEYDATRPNAFKEFIFQLVKSSIAFHLFDKCFGLIEANSRSVCAQPVDRNAFAAVGWHTRRFAP